MLPSTCASRHDGAYFCNSSTSKSAPTMRCFRHEYLQTRFAPQSRALFEHLNFQKWLEAAVFEMFETCSLPNLLRATMACNLSSLISRDGSAPAALASLLFDPPEPKNVGNNSVSRLFSLFARFDLLSSDSSHLCFSICLYCWKFDFKTSFG